MRYVAAALLVALGGGDVNAKAIEKILKAAGADADEVGKVVSELAGKDITALLAEGIEKISSVPSGGGGVAAPPAAAAADAPAAAAPAKKEESEEEEDDDMGFGLFD